MEGKNFVQSSTILRHIGRRYNLYGDSDDERATIDNLVDAASDLTNGYCLSLPFM